MNRKVKSAFLRYRKLSKQKGVIEREMKLLKDFILIPALQDDVLMDKQGIILLQYTRYPKITFNQEDFRMVYPKLYEEFCFTTEEKKLLIKDKL